MCFVKANKLSLHRFFLIREMFRLISIFMLKVFGWKKVGVFPEGKKFIVLAAPHTSMWDFVWGKFYYAVIRKSVMFMIKEKYFSFPLGILLRFLGAIPVTAGRKPGMVEQMVEQFKQRDEFLLTITPEATRKKVKRWKRGFYHIALEAQVDVVLGFIDYKKKELGILGSINLSGDEKADMEKIRLFYENISGKFPENFNSKII